jgi:thiamine-monophosphate kinase
MLGEHALLERLRQLVRQPPPHVAVGIGDDAAIVVPDRGALIAVSTDALIEDVHFRRAWSPPRAIGRKALAVALSDLAAIGAAPRASFLSLALPDNFPVGDFDALLVGFVTLAGSTGAALAGGNIARSPGPLVLDVTVMGAVKRRRWIERRGGQPGDEIFVTGDLGAAAAGLALLQSGPAAQPIDEAGSACIRRYEQPEPRLRMGFAIGSNRAASAGIDLSDGLADGARQLATAAGTGVVIDAAAVPISDATRRLAAQLHLEPLKLALSGGEDYELLFAVRSRRRRTFLAAARRGGGLPITRIGRLTREPGAWLEQDGRTMPLPLGFVH